MILTGPRAEIRSGYQLALAAKKYKLVRDNPGDYSFEAQVESVNEFWLSREPLELRVFVGQSAWKWKGVAPVVSNGTVTARVQGEPER